MYTKKKNWPLWVMSSNYDVQPKHWKAEESKYVVSKKTQKFLSSYFVCSTIIEAKAGDIS